jgi:hypothetical protein
MIKSKRMRWEGRIVWIGEKKNACNLLIGKPAVKRPLGSPRCKWMDNIKMDLWEIGLGDMDWIGVAHYWENGGLLLMWQ